MASPQKENGYTAIANELFEAYLCIAITLTLYENAVWLAILRKTYGYHKTEDYISHSQIEALTGIQRSHVVRTIKKLKASNMIISNAEQGKISLLAIQKDYAKWVLPKQVTLPVPKQVHVPLGAHVPLGDATCTQAGTGHVPRQVHTKDILKDTYTKDIYCRAKHDLVSPVEYLNAKIQSHYDPKNKSTQSFVLARYNEGRTLDDFKRVIDRKAAQWLSDPKMAMYLRPSTLFNRTNFENYLNEAEAKEVKYNVEDKKNDFLESVKGRKRFEFTPSG